MVACVAWYPGIPPRTSLLTMSVVGLSGPHSILTLKNRKQILCLTPRQKLILIKKNRITSHDSKSVSDTELLSLNVSDADIPNSNISNFNIVFGSGNELGIFSVNGNVITVNGELIDCESTTNTKKQYVLPILVQDSVPYGRPRVGGSFLFISVSLSLRHFFR